MPQKYYSLLVREDGFWSIQFGDYDRAVVEQEREDTYLRQDSGDTERYRAKDIKIIATGASQAHINAEVNRLNHQEG